MFLTVTVCYANETSQKIITLSVPEHSSVFATILLSGMLDIFPEINFEKMSVGIFSKKCQLSDLVKEGDRIEIYRPLMIDPKEARRKRAKL